MIRVTHLKESQVYSKARSGVRKQLSPSPVETVGKQFAELSRHLGGGCFAVASVLPKGSLEVVRIELTCLDRHDDGSRIVDDLKLYSQAVSWTALRDNRPTSGDRSAVLTANGKQCEQGPQIAAAPLPNAVFDGYPGVLLAYRGAADHRYSAEDLVQLGKFGEEISESLRKNRQKDAAAESTVAAGEMPAGQLFVALDADHRPWMNGDQFNAMDEQLRANLLQAVSKLSAGKSDEPQIEDVSIMDSMNRIRTVRLVVQPSTPAKLNGHSNGSKSKKDATGIGPQFLCCFTPPASDWMRLRPDDFNGDAETKRLVPAIDFMTRDVGNQPGLFEIADSVSLSPFHFHRRFTELFGVTPKDLLLSAQIAHARKLLSQPDQALSEIARVCGFAHQSHFTSRFKQTTGLTPTRWRRMLNTDAGRAGLEAKPADVAR